MKQFFKFMFASMLGTFLMLLLGFFLMIGIFASIISLAGKEEVKISSKSVLYISLEGIVTDRTSNNPFENFDFNTMKSRKELGLNDILLNLKKAKTDANIKGIFLERSVGIG